MRRAAAASVRADRPLQMGRRGRSSSAEGWRQPRRRGPLAAAASLAPGWRQLVAPCCLWHGSGLLGNALFFLLRR